ncbi:MAG: FMN-binding protein [Methanophagales archaeon ANME-1-THS]|nr:MAG: FMN-binding protein [Methanophagales archaeon ANME-1-THS]
MSELKRILSISIPLILICIISGATLALSFDLTKERIREVEERKITESLASIFPDASFRKTGEYYTVLVNGEEIGYAFLAEGQGYSGTIKTMVGLYQNGTLSHIYVVSQLETPGLGTRIIEPEFTNQFSGKRIEDLRLRREGGLIDSITGATISSRAITEIVRTRAEVIRNET